MGLRLGFPDNVTRADVLLTNQAAVYVQGNGGGNIAVNARNLEVSDRSRISAGIGQGLGDTDSIAGDIVLNASGDMAITSGSLISNLVRREATGHAGNIFVDANSLLLRDDVFLYSSTYGNGNVGNVVIRAANSVSVANRTGILSTVTSTGVGNGGNIDISAATLSLTNNSQVVASTFGLGNAGNIAIRVKDSVSLTSKAAIVSAVHPFAIGNSGNIDINAGSLSLTDGSRLETYNSGGFDIQNPIIGNAGNVNIKVTGAVHISGELDGLVSSINSDLELGTFGRGGDITIDSDSFSLQDGAQLSASIFGQGSAGNVILRTKASVLLGGDAYIFSTVGASGTGKGGNIDINATSLSLQDGGQLITSLSGQGEAGNVTVQATDFVSITNAAILSTIEAGGVGKGGNINIDTASLSLQDIGQLATATRGALNNQPAGQGDAGNVNIKVSGTVDIAGRNNNFRSAIFSRVEDTDTVGNGGNITIVTGSLLLRDGARLNAPSFGKGNGGNITIRAADIVFLKNGGIISALGTDGVGNGGTIVIDAMSIFLTEESQIVAATQGKGNSGSVSLRAANSIFLADNASKHF